MVILSNGEDWYNPHIVINDSIPDGFRVFVRANAFALK